MMYRLLRRVSLRLKLLGAFAVLLLAVAVATGAVVLTSLAEDNAADAVSQSQHVTGNLIEILWHISQMQLLTPTI